MTYWLAEIVEPNLAPLTYATYETLSRLYIVPGLGTKRLDARLSVRDVQTWLNKVAKSCQCCTQGKDERRPPKKQKCCAVGRCCQDLPSARTVKGIRAVLRSALAQAVVEELLAKNVAALVKLPPIRNCKASRGTVSRPARSSNHPATGTTTSTPPTSWSSCSDSARAKSSDSPGSTSSGTAGTSLALHMARRTASTAATTKPVPSDDSLLRANDGPALGRATDSNVALYDAFYVTTRSVVSCERVVEQLLLRTRAMMRDLRAKNGLYRLAPPARMTGRSSCGTPGSRTSRRAPGRYCTWPRGRRSRHCGILPQWADRRRVSAMFRHRSGTATSSVCPGTRRRTEHRQ